MQSYWERRREIEEKERIEKELKQIVRLNFTEEAEDYDKQCHSKQQ